MWGGKEVGGGEWEEGDGLDNAADEHKPSEGNRTRIGTMCFCFPVRPLLLQAQGLVKTLIHCTITVIESNVQVLVVTALIYKDPMKV